MFEIVEVKTALFEFVNWDFSFALRINVPIEVELPCRYRFWQIAIFITESDSKLDYFELIDTIFDSLVLPLVFGAAFKFTLQETWELGVHRDIGVLFQQLC